MASSPRTAPSSTFPTAGGRPLLAPQVPEGFLAELRRRGIPFAAGQCLVDADANEAPRLLEVIRTLELPLVLIFNRGRVMTSPQGVSKATGLRVALETLRLSARNTVAIGDAENDHELLRLAEVGVAVEWGSKALQAAADVVLTGGGPPAVAAYIRKLAAAGSLPIPPRGRRRLLLGHLEDGREFSLAVRGRNVLVTGDAKSGKSWVAGLLCEQLILHGYCVCAIDPEGDYSSLEGLPGVTVLGREDPPPTPRELLRALRYPDRSVVIDLSRLPHDEKLQYIRAVLPALNVLRRRTGLPHRILLDEAHYYLHDADAPQLLDFDRNGYTIVTYCASRLPQALLAATEVMIVTCESNPAEMEALRACCAKCGAIRCRALGDPRSLESRPGGCPADHRRGRRRAAAVHDCAAPHASCPSSGKVRRRAGEHAPRVRLQRQRSTGTPDPHAPPVRVRAGGNTGTAVGGVHRARRLLALDRGRVRRSGACR